MKLYEFGDKNNPSIMMIHGGGNAWWNYLRQARALSDRFHVILPTLDGHGEEFLTEYVSTEDTADKLLDYIEKNCFGKLYALCGVSLGGQIVMEMLSRKTDLTQKAIIDGSICYPNRAMAHFCIGTVQLFSKLLFGEKACRLQLYILNKFAPSQMRYPEEINAYYMQDMPRIRKQTLCTMYRTYMMQYMLKESVRETKAQVMYWYGEKEMACVKKSARMFQSYVPSCEIYEAKGCGHGYLALYLPDKWMAVAGPFLDKSIEGRYV